MGNPYVRQSAASIITGAEITAAPLNAEFNALRDTFDASAGHTHDGSTGESQEINLTTSIAGVLPVVNGGIAGIHKVDATTAPTVNEDTGDGYSVGSIWVDVTNDLSYICVDSTSTAAVWLLMGDADLAAIASLAKTDGNIIVADGSTWVAESGATARISLGVAIGSDVQAWSAVLDATTASFLTADETKLDGIETSADVTDETNVISSLSGATLTAVTVATNDKVVLQDASDTDNIKTVTAQSIANLAPAGGDMDASTYDPTSVVGDAFAMDNMVEGTTTKILTSTERIKLSGIEISADVTDTTNVTSAGAHMSGGADVPVTDGGTGVSTLTDGGVLLGSGTGDITAMAVLADGEMIVGDGTTAPVAESGATLRTSIGVAIGSDVQAHDAVLDATTASFLIADETKLDGIETAADVTDETNVVSSLDGATLTAVTVATGDKVVVQDVSDTNNIKTVTVQSIVDLAGGVVGIEDIGSFILASIGSGTASPNTTKAGSALSYTGTNNATSGGPSGGTWRAHGYISAAGFGTVFQRIS